jgi:hypothetical protein
MNKEQELRDTERRERRIDEALRETFPASDPPSFVGAGAQRPTEYKTGEGKPRKAAEMAGEIIDQQADLSASSEEREPEAKAPEGPKGVSRTAARSSAWEALKRSVVSIPSGGRRHNGASHSSIGQSPRGQYLPEYNHPRSHKQKPQIRQIFCTRVPRSYQAPFLWAFLNQSRPSPKVSGARDTLS